VKGEPGTARPYWRSRSQAWARRCSNGNVKSTTKRCRGLYEYDAVSRLARQPAGDARVADIRNYIKRGKLWDAFVSDERRCC